MRLLALPERCLTRFKQRPFVTACEPLNAAAPTSSALKPESAQLAPRHSCRLRSPRWCAFVVARQIVRVGGLVYHALFAHVAVKAQAECRIAHCANSSIGPTWFAASLAGRSSCGLSRCFKQATAATWTRSKSYPPVLRRLVT